MTLFWVVTLQWQAGGFSRTKTATGTLLPGQVAALETSQAAFPAILAGARRDMQVPHEAHPVVLFYSLDRNELTALGSAE
jgi:predicted short-subunit dehydrogenase-like oxidoreductase (DUF2520 family)